MLLVRNERFVTRVHELNTCVPSNENKFENVGNLFPAHGRKQSKGKARLGNDVRSKLVEVQFSVSIKGANDRESIRRETRIIQRLHPDRALHMLQKIIYNGFPAHDGVAFDTSWPLIARACLDFVRCCPPHPWWWSSLLLRQVLVSCLASLCLLIYLHTFEEPAQPHYLQHCDIVRSDARHQRRHLL